MASQASATVEPNQPETPGSPPEPPYLGAARETGRAGILGLLGGIGILAGAFLPIFGSGNPYSIVDIGQIIGLGYWYALAQIGIGVTAAIVGLALLARAVRSPIAGGALIGLGLAGAIGYVGYIGGGTTGDGPGAGSWTGLIGSIAVIVGGAWGLRENPSPAPASQGQPTSLGTWLVDESFDPRFAPRGRVDLEIVDDNLFIYPGDDPIAVMPVGRVNIREVDDLVFQLSDGETPLATFDWESGPDAGGVARQLSQAKPKA